MVIHHIQQDRHMYKTHHVHLSHPIPRKAEAVKTVVIHHILQDLFICKTLPYRGDIPRTTHHRHIGKIIPLTDFQWPPHLHLPYNLLQADILVIHYIPILKSQSIQLQAAVQHIPKARIHNGLHLRIDIAEVRNRRLLLRMEELGKVHLIIIIINLGEGGVIQIQMIAHLHTCLWAIRDR